MRPSGKAAAVGDRATSDLPIAIGIQTVQFRVCYQAIARSRRPWPAVDLKNVALSVRRGQVDMCPLEPRAKDSTHNAVEHLATFALFLPADVLNFAGGIGVVSVVRLQKAVVWI